LFSLVFLLQLFVNYDVFCANVTAAPLEGTMGDGKVRILDLACRGGALEDRVSAVCKQANAASSI
jgi:hypothetical protein